MCLDRGSNLGLHGRIPCLEQSGCYVLSDGAARASTQSSSAAWAIVSFDGASLVLVAAGAMLFEEHVSSQTAETVAMELGLAALLKLSRGYSNIIPHEVQTIIDVFEFVASNPTLLCMPSVSKIGEDTCEYVF